MTKCIPSLPTSQPARSRAFVVVRRLSAVWQTHCHKVEKRRHDPGCQPRLPATTDPSKSVNQSSTFGKYAQRKSDYLRSGISA